ncbi:MAG: ATP-binding cassette domain-containing protein [Mesorhizobium sp.]|nr:MAG: ATP-binding cassette domain-containing protein [Mesorhizobium sp.]
MAGVSSLLARLPGRAAGKPAAPATVSVDSAKFKGTLIAKGLTKSYKGRKVVSGVTLGVRAGEAVGLLGPNGAGKTTCFYMVTGLVPVDEGTIEIDGFDVTSMPMYRRARLGLEIARALATRPAYMLLDEPFAGIDPIAVADIQQLVRHLTARGIGVLITDHNVRETLGLIDRAYIIHAGQVLTHGRADEIVANADVRRLYLGEGFTL